MKYTPLILVLIGFVICVNILTPNSKLSRKDCMLAEISPDFSIKEKELCKAQYAH